MFKYLQQSIPRKLNVIANQGNEESIYAVKGDDKQDDGETTKESEETVDKERKVKEEKQKEYQ